MLLEFFSKGASMKRLVAPLAKAPVTMAVTVGLGWAWYLARPKLILEDVAGVAKDLMRTPELVEVIIQKVVLPFAKAPPIDKLSFLAEASAVCYNHTLSQFDHHFQPLHVMRYFMQAGLSVKEAQSKAASYERMIYKLIRPCFRYARPFWERGTAHPWLDDRKEALSRKMTRTWDIYFPKCTA